MRLVTPLDTWFAGPAPRRRFRARWLGRAPVVLRPRDRAWRRIAPGFDACAAMAARGLPFQIVADRRYERSGDGPRLRRALAEGATVFLPQVHQVLPRLARLMVALRAGLLGPSGAACSFLFLVEGRGRPGMGLHHDGAADAFWLQLVGRRRVTLGPPVRPGPAADLDDRLAGSGPGWRTLELGPGTLFHLPAFTPHAVVCRGRSLALSLTWSRRGRPRGAGGAPEWDVVSGQARPRPRSRRGVLWTQLPVVAGPPGRTRRCRLRLPEDHVLALPSPTASLARRLALMPRLEQPRGALAPLITHGVLAPEDLPLQIVPDNPRALDGWRFA